MPARIARLMRLGVLAVLGVCIVAMGWLGLQYVRFAWGQETPVLNWNFGLVYLAIPFGALLMLLHLALIAGPYVRERAFRKDGALSGEEATL
jgi:TRAP-type C4-dicarboxylate transport system permease small subunit